MTASTGRTRLDHDQDAARTFEHLHELGRSPGPFGIFPFGQDIDEIFRLRICAIVNGDGKTVPLDIERNVPSHHFQTDDSKCLAGHTLILLPERGSFRAGCRSASATSRDVNSPAEHCGHFADVLQYAAMN